MLLNPLSACSRPRQTIITKAKTTTTATAMTTTTATVSSGISGEDSLPADIRCRSTSAVATKRASIHSAEGSATSKRLSLLLNHSRCRSFSESWTFLSSPSSSSTTSSPSAPNGAPAFLEGATANELKTLHMSSRPTSSSTSLSSSSSHHSSASNDSSVATTSTCPSPLLPLSDARAEAKTTTTEAQRKGALDQALLESLAAFLEDHHTSNASNDHDEVIQASSSRRKEATSSLIDTGDLDVTDLVVAVRDFGYPKSHPFHFGNYPPEPAHEESDISEDVEDDDDDDGYDYQWDDHHTDTDVVEPMMYDNDVVEDAIDYDPTWTRIQTQGYVRALYDFEGENATELSFKEGESFWIHCRQFSGWLLAEINGIQGLVPENYVQLV